MRNIREVYDTTKKERVPPIQEVEFPEILQRTQIMIMKCCAKIYKQYLIKS